MKYLLILLFPIAGYFVALHNHEEHLLAMSFAYGFGIPITCFIMYFAAWTGNKK